MPETELRRSKRQRAPVAQPPPETEEEMLDRKEKKRKKNPKVKVAEKVEITEAKEEINNEEDEEEEPCSLEDPIPEEEAKQEWPNRYPIANISKEASSIKKREDSTVLKAKCHYRQAKVGDCVYHLYDDVYVKAGENEKPYIARIVELFESCKNELYFTARWFFRAEDTVIKGLARELDLDQRRVFLSDDNTDNALSCILAKVRILHITPKVGIPLTDEEMSGFDLYYDMSYTVAYSSFASLPSDVWRDVGGSSSTVTACGRSDADSEGSTSGMKSELLLLDLFSGCGAMSTGLCLGANLAGVHLKTRWAVDLNIHACESLQYNHPETEVRNEKAEDFFAIIREWQKLCQKYNVESGSSCSPEYSSEDEATDDPLGPGEFEVGKILGICWGKTDKHDNVGLKFKVRWKGYGPSEDTWEPADGLSNCQKKIKEFVTKGYQKNILPLPGSVDVICGGPPCQGFSGFNRFRNKFDPFNDEKNAQLPVFMEIVEFLKPKFVLMENVVDMLKYLHGYGGRFALSRLVEMNYQVRMGILAAGNYGVPQYRMRVFLWGAHPSQKLPQFPLPTHKVITRGSPPVEFETHFVAYHEHESRELPLENALRLEDAISDLPPIENDESRDEISYGQAPKTEFQHYIRLSHEEMIHPSSTAEKPAQKKRLFDHRPLCLNADDYERVCRVPKRKGANFRDLPGLIVGAGNIVKRDPDVERVDLPSGKPLVPEYAISHLDGKSTKCFGRLWWDETVPTVVTRAEPHNQVIMHPVQDRVLSIRENARLQGFPDYYRLFGPIKERYMQVGNAVAVPVARALGYALAVSYLGKPNEEPVFALPRNFPLNVDH